MQPRNEFLWIPLLPKVFIEQLINLGFDDDTRRKSEWPQDIQEEYSRLRGAFTKAKAEYTSFMLQDRDSRMTQTAKTITVGLLEHLNFDNGRCDPSHQLIADKLGLSRRTVERLVPKIAAAGWVEIKRRGCKATNIYRFRVSATKVAAIMDYADYLRDRRIEEREKRWKDQFAPSDPTSVTDQASSDPTSVRSLDPTSVSVLDPTSVSDKPLNRTPEDEPLKPMKGSEGEGYTLRAPPRETDHANAYLRAKEGL
jgi:hypothetical protein